MVTARRAPVRAAEPPAAPARPAARAPVRAGSRAPVAAPVTSGYHGAEGRRKMAEEEAANAARREAASQNASMPFRFFCPVGEAREIVIVDDEPNFFRYEHNMKDQRSGKWSIFCACINESAHCPVCKVSERQAYFAMYLTVIDLTPYESEKHGLIEWSKKLLVVKSAQQKKITRLWERHGSLRGMVLQMTRDGEKDASIGNDIEFVEFLPEEELEAYVTTYETERDGKREVKEIVGSEVFDYDALFPAPTEQQLRAIVGGRPEAGSREDNERTVGRRPARGGTDWDEQRPPPRTRASSRPADDGLPQDDAPPARAAVRRPTRTPEPEDVEPPQRPSVRRPAPAPAPAAAPVRRPVRAAAPEPEDAPLPAASMAERRKALRRGG